MPAGKNAPRAARDARAKEAPELEQHAAPGSDEPLSAASSEDESGQLEKLLEDAKSEAELYKNEAARAKADFYNYRTRVERDRARDRTLAAEGAVDALIPVLDNLDRTLQAVPDKDSPLYKGVSMVQRQFFSALQNLGLEVIATDCPFDPSQHEAIVVADVEESSDDGRILEELHRGYKLGDKVLRAAQVKIGRKN
ncbi:MAG: nucleotide exchange factor GrpE [Synergistaceae bacterium]|jgi:molecular chaperone GrpE (heat shock protein)|nr:nucleotide exchange factor GrpE [Synergistaceae bacterium]